MLSETEVAAYERDGFVRAAGAVPRDVADACRAELWAATGCDPDDPSTWTEPVIRIDGRGTPPFRAAATAAPLHEAYDQIVGPGRWAPRTGLGTFPIRFPSEREPGDDGWHLEASFTGPDGEYRVNAASRGRALLLLFLFSEVGPSDAPTRIRVGSHRDVPPLLAGTGAEGRAWSGLCADAAAASAHRPLALATGSPGDVYLCHPFLVHAAQPHRGRVPRFMAQPPLECART